MGDHLGAEAAAEMTVVVVAKASQRRHSLEADRPNRCSEDAVPVAAVVAVASIAFATTETSVPPAFSMAVAVAVAVVYASTVASAATGLDRFQCSVLVLAAVAMAVAVVAAVVDVVAAVAAVSGCLLGYASTTYWCRVEGFVLEVDD